MVIKDKKGREIIRIGNTGSLAVARYPDMDEKTKEDIVEIYEELTGQDSGSTRSFLDFEDDNDEFCS